MAEEISIRIYTLSRYLFDGKLIRLVIPDLDKDPPVVSQWTHNPAFMRLIDDKPAMPQSPFRVRKKLETLLKEDSGKFYFHIRASSDDRLIGFAHLFNFEWKNANALLKLGIASESDRRYGYGREAMNLLLHYAFMELNLSALWAWTYEYNLAAQKFLEKCGFAQEVRRRQAIHGDGKFWDELIYGLQAVEWRENTGSISNG